MPFLGDDYSILDKTRDASFVSLWGRERLFSHWWRPWSRELHYWVLQRLVGLPVAPWHIASFTLWLGSMAAYLAIGRRVIGLPAAALAAACVAALASWGGTLLWVAGVQELWMLLWAMLFLLAFASRRTVPALAALALALLSKETAGVLPGIALVWSVAVDRDRPAAALRRIAPVAALLVVWMVVHPWILPRLRGAPVEAVEAGTRPSPPIVALRTGLALVNLEQRPAPAIGWGASLAGGAAGIVALAGFALWALLRARRAPAAPVPGAAAFTLAWAALGTLPMLMPSIGWHAYYGLLGALGVWLLIAPWLMRAPALAFAVVLALAVLRPLRADTPSWDWSSKAYFQRAGFFIEALRTDLLRRHPTLPSHSRLYFSQVPQNIGLVVADGPAFRVWYDDPTLRAGFYSAYAPPVGPAGESRDYFFKFDTTLTWREVVEGPEDLGSARAADPEWEEDHRELALVLGSAGDWNHAAGEMIKLQQAFPDRVAYAVNLAFVYARLQDTTQALAWYRRAAAMPNASPSVREAAAEFENRLQRRR